MAPYEALYGCRCILPIRWFELGKVEIIWKDSVKEVMEKVHLFIDRLKTTWSRQKSYADVRRRDLEFEIDIWIFQEVSPMKGVMRFGHKVNLRPRYVGPYIILKRVGDVAYE